MSDEFRVIQQELAQIKQILATIVGAADRSVAYPFSADVLQKVAKDFLKLGIERGDRVEEEHLRKYVKTAPYHAGSWLRKEFAFTNCYRHGRYHYYSKKDLIALNEELLELSF